MKAMLVAVGALQQLQELFLFSSAKMVPRCFCCLTGCWQEPPFWIVLIVVLLTAAEPGSQALSHRPCQEQAAWGTPALSTRHPTRDRLRLDQDAVPVAGQGELETGPAAVPLGQGPMTPEDNEMRSWTG